MPLIRHDGTGIRPIDELLFDAIKEFDWHTAHFILDSTFSSTLTPSLSSQDENHESLLLVAIKHRGIKFSNKLLERVSANDNLLQANLFNSDAQGKNCFHYLAMYGKKKLFARLFHLHQSRFPERSPLWMQADDEGMLPQHYAAKFADDGLLDFLINTVQVNVHQGDVQGNTMLNLIPFIPANLKQIARCIEKGAHFFIKNNQGQTFLSAFIRAELSLQINLFHQLNAGSKDYLMYFYLAYLLNHKDEEQAIAHFLRLVPLYCLRVLTFSELAFKNVDTTIQEQAAAIAIFDGSAQIVSSYMLEDELIELTDFINSIEAYSHALEPRINRLTVCTPRLLSKVSFFASLIVLYVGLMLFLGLKFGQYLHCANGDASCPNRETKVDNYFMGLALFGVLGAVIPGLAIVGMIKCISTKDRIPKEEIVSRDEWRENIAIPLQERYVTPLQDLQQIDEEQQTKHTPTSPELVQQLGQIWEQLSSVNLPISQLQQVVTDLISRLKTLNRDMSQKGSSIGFFWRPRKALTGDAVIDMPVASSSSGDGLRVDEIELDVFIPEPGRAEEEVRLLAW